MCGLAGFWTYGGGSIERMTEEVTAMTATLRHRGPDDQSMWSEYVDRWVARTHR